MPRTRKDTRVDQLRAFLRIRPLTEEELARQSVPTSCIFSIQDPSNLRTYIPPSSVYFRRDVSNEENFEFSHIFDEDASQEEIFEKCIIPDIISLFNSTSVLIFAYGITNSGKSYTIRGQEERLGVIPRFAEALFRIIAGCQVQYPSDVPITVNHMEKIDYEKLLQCRSLIDGGNDEYDEKLHMFLRDPERFSDGLFYKEITGLLLRSDSEADELDKVVLDEQFEACGVWCSYVEIYNNLVFDLLSPRRRAITVGEDKKGCPFAKQLTRVPVFSPDEMLRLFDHGRSKLKIAATMLNRNSSRSHSIFSVCLVAECLKTKTIVVRNMDFCDLAGSERCQKAGGVGTHLLETCKINSSLSALHRCFECLRQRSRKGNPVKPSYRESKLTRLFQPYFEGFGLVRMIANVCFDLNSYDETLAVLRFSSLAQQVKTTRKDSVHHVRSTVAPLQNNYLENVKEDVDPTSQTMDENAAIYAKWSKSQLIRRLVSVEQENRDLADQRDRMLSNWILQLEEVQLSHQKDICAMEEAWGRSLNSRIKEVEQECRDIYQQRIRCLKNQKASRNEKDEKADYKDDSLLTVFHDHGESEID